MIPFVAVELLGYWLGGGTAARLGELLGVTREHAQREVLNEYRDRHPGLIAAKRGSGFRMEADEFDLRYAPHTVSGLLDVFRGLAAEADGQGADWLLRPHFVSTSASADTGTKATAMQALLTACVHRRCIDIDYVSKRRLSRIRFSPHALVACAMRPHFRGFAVGKDYERYADIVPGRVRAMHDSDRGDYVGSDGDVEWHDYVDLTFEVNCDLAEEIRNSIIEENEGSSSLHIANVRHAVAMYIRREVEWRFVQDRIVRAWCLLSCQQSPKVLLRSSPV